MLTPVGADTYFKLPRSVSRAQAGTIPLAAATAWLALCSKDCLALDRSQAKGNSVLVWGGSSSVGLYAIQPASQRGFDVVTTCNPKHADLVLSYGAKHVFDYKDEKFAEKIKAAAPNLLHAFDTIGNKGSSAAAFQAFFSDPGSICTVRPGRANTENVVQGTCVTDMLPLCTELILLLQVSKHDHELVAELFKKVPEWLEKGYLKPSSPKVLPGLDAVADGFQEYGDGKISAYKIVYEL
ncbi:hypothetical protein BDW59DRAFT_164978 [Aspergillus cavernicola]|uniref:Alcohol dehydrogenase-like C-terminal domain-containing protein n=1 Tax=Aspergillus cavernicola TaxID=176166 RepID=A0ABR4HVX5_9EURO